MSIETFYRNRLQRILASEGFGKNAAPNYRPDARAYLKDPDACPYCGSANIVPGEFRGDWDEAWRSVECENCEAMWQETFSKPTGFEPDRGPQVDADDLAQPPKNNSPMSRT